MKRWRVRGFLFRVPTICHGDLWKGLTVLYTLKRERKCPWMVGVPNLFQRAESCGGSVACLPCRIFSLSCLLVSASGSNRERGLLVDSGWDSALALQPSGSVTLCKFLTLAEPRGDHSLLSRPSTDMLPQLKNGKARYLAQSCAYVRHSGWCLIVMWDGFQAATQVWGTS